MRLRSRITTGNGSKLMSAPSQEALLEHELLTSIAHPLQLYSRAQSCSKQLYAWNYGFTSRVGVSLTYGTMRRTSLLLLCLLLSLVEVHSETAPYLTFNDSVIPNNSYVDLSLMMYPGDDDTTADISSTVICHTDLTTCCRSKAGPGRGNWFFPNGNSLPGATMNNDEQVPIAERRQDQLVRLQRGPVGTISDIPDGIYCCDIETMAVNSADNTARETVYVGVYGSGGMYIIPVNTDIIM